MEAVSFSETSATYQSTRRDLPDDSDFGIEEFMFCARREFSHF